MLEGNSCLLWDFFFPGLVVYSTINLLVMGEKNKKQVTLTIPVRCSLTFCNIYNIDTTWITHRESIFLWNKSLPLTSHQCSSQYWLMFAGTPHGFWTHRSVTLPCPALAHPDVGSGFNLPSSDIRNVCRALNLPKGWAGVDRRRSAV